MMDLTGNPTRDRHQPCRARIEALEAERDDNEGEILRLAAKVGNLEIESARMRKLLLEYRAVAQQNSAGTPAGCDSQRWYKEEIAAIDAAIKETEGK